MSFIEMIKKNVLVIVAIATVIGFSSYGYIEHKVSAKNLAGQYWNFNGGDALDANSYTPASQNEDCTEGSEVCQIFAPSNNNPLSPRPLLSAISPNHGSETVENRILDALDNGSQNETVTMKD